MRIKKERAGALAKIEECNKSLDAKSYVKKKEELDKEFKGQDRIKELQKEKARIDSELDLDKQENMRNIEEDINEEEMER